MSHGAFSEYFSNSYDFMNDYLNGTNALEGTSDAIQKEVRSNSEVDSSVVGILSIFRVQKSLVISMGSILVLSLLSLSYFLKKCKGVFRFFIVGKNLFFMISCAFFIAICQAPKTVDHGALFLKVKSFI